MTDRPVRHEITKYPNRRFYDVTLSRHVTLSDLHELVADGNEIVVTDKTAGRDITNIVLTLIILEHDPPKMELFPSSLLHQAIQMNENVVRRFIDQYFAQALNAFSQSRQQFDSFLGRTGVNPSLPKAPMDWFRMFMPGASSNPGASSPGQSAASSDEETSQPSRRDDASPGDDDLAELRRQVAAMSDQLARLQPESGKRPGNRRKKTKKKTSRKGTKS